MKTTTNHLRNILLAALLATSLIAPSFANDNLMARYRFTYTVVDHLVNRKGYLVYAHPMDKHPGPAGLTTEVSSRIQVERDADGVITRLSDGRVEILIRPSEQEWASEDPNAFDIVSKNLEDGGLIRINTVARIERDGLPVMVDRSVFWGNEAKRPGLPSLKKGDAQLSEMVQPEPGFSVLTRGREVDGEYIPESRNTRIRFRDNAQLRLHRIIDETYCATSGEWITSSDELREWKRYDHVWRDTRLVINPDGEAITEEWEYYAKGEATGADGRTADVGQLKRQLKRDGSEAHFQYLHDGRIIETRHPDGSLRLFTEKNEEISEDTRLRTAIETVDGKEVFRETKEFGPIRHTFTVKVPGQPDRVTISEFYPDDSKFRGSYRKRIFPDGRMITYERSKLEDGTSKLIEEEGMGDGERVIHGTRTTTIFGNRPDTGKTVEPFDHRK